MAPDRGQNDGIRTRNLLSQSTVAFNHFATFYVSDLAESAVQHPRKPPGLTSPALVGSRYQVRSVGLEPTRPKWTLPPQGSTSTYSIMTARWPGVAPTGLPGLPSRQGPRSVKGKGLGRTHRLLRRHRQTPPLILRTQGHKDRRCNPSAGVAGLPRLPQVLRAGFEPAKAEPTVLQTAPFVHFGTSACFTGPYFSGATQTLWQLNPS